LGNRSVAPEGTLPVKTESADERKLIGAISGCGNEAPYSIYGYKNEKDANGKWIPREKADYDAMTDEEKAAEGMESGHHENPQVNVRAFTSIGNIYGGGNNAEVTGNTNVNIGKKEGE
jgi:hypothetical protein